MGEERRGRWEGGEWGGEGSRGSGSGRWEGGEWERGRKWEVKDRNVGRCKGKGREGGWNVSMGNGNVVLDVEDEKLMDRVDIVLPVV